MCDQKGWRAKTVMWLQFQGSLHLVTTTTDRLENDQLLILDNWAWP